MSWLSEALGGGKSKTTVQQYPNWNKEQQDVFNQLSNMINLGGTNTVPSLSVGVTPQEQSYFNTVNQLASNPAWQNVLSGTANINAVNDLYENSIKPAAMKQLTETTLPQIQEAYAGPGYYGSSRARALTRAAEQTGQDLNSTYAQLMYQAKQDAINNMLQGTQEYAGLQGTAGELARQIEQEKVAGDLQTYLLGGTTSEGESNPIYNPSVNLALSLLGFSPFSYGSNTTQTGAGLLNSLLSGAAPGIGQGIAAAMMAG